MGYFNLVNNTSTSTIKNIGYKENTSFKGLTTTPQDNNSIQYSEQTNENGEKSGKLSKKVADALKARMLVQTTIPETKNKKEYKEEIIEKLRKKDPKQYRGYEEAIAEIISSSKDTEVGNEILDWALNHPKLSKLNGRGLMKLLELYITVKNLQVNQKNYPLPDENSVDYNINLYGATNYIPDNTSCVFSSQDNQSESTPSIKQFFNKYSKQISDIKDIFYELNASQAQEYKNYKKPLAYITATAKDRELAKSNLYQIFDYKYGKVKPEAAYNLFASATQINNEAQNFSQQVILDDDLIHYWLKYHYS